ncbi:phosphoenolpyruvate--protein phosphotransferase [Candidatus Sumerlaeota bacterium]|nr:phosphoenolpyruvate--protein phosphotransferase [Candidatus Sumerlaeota bacterium]
MTIRRTFFFDGLGVSGGVVLGPAFVIETHGAESESHSLAASEVEQEVERFQDAIERARVEVTELGRTVAERIDAQQAAIFDAHAVLLTDPHLINRTIKGIREERKNAEFIFWSVTRDIGEQLAAIGDSYFSERSHDLYDVSRRVIKLLRNQQNNDGVAVPPGSIIVANDLGPSETAQFHREQITGFVTNSGGPTSHTAIMAKALSLPAVVGLDYITHYVRNGDFLILDGTQGKVILHPTQQMIDFYREQAVQFNRERETMAELRSLPAETLDGVRITLEANIEFAEELDLVAAQGAEGIGLYRTEFFFMGRDKLPTEDEQEEAYSTVLKAMGDAPVVFRTLDVGGDKISMTIPMAAENNPFLGLRAIRLCLAHPELLRLQLRPLMRAAAGKKLHLLIPMVCGLEEIAQTREHLREVREQLMSEGTQLPKEVLLGVMIEIPSAALQADMIAREVDFLSIGTNDLVQYTLAVDRVNKMVGHLFNETHPAVLHLIHRVVTAGNAAGKPVTVCGEMAGDVMHSLLLIGLGIRRLSMSPSLIGPVKRAIRSVEMKALEKIAAGLLCLSTAQEVRTALQAQIGNLF